MKCKMIALSGLLLCSMAQGDANEPQNRSPAYTADGRLLLPENYRDWVFLTSSFDMSYMQGMQMGDHTLDNVFVNPESYKSFLATGTWPDKTLLLKENRLAPSEVPSTRPAITRARKSSASKFMSRTKRASGTSGGSSPLAANSRRS